VTQLSINYRMTKPRRLEGSSRSHLVWPSAQSRSLRSGCHSGERL